MNSVRLTVHQGKDGQWYGRVQSCNGRILLSTEGFPTKWNAKRGLAGACVAAYIAVMTAEFGFHGCADDWKEDLVKDLMATIKVVEG